MFKQASPFINAGPRGGISGSSVWVFKHTYMDICPTGCEPGKRSVALPERQSWGAWPLAHACTRLGVRREPGGPFLSPTKRFSLAVPLASFLLPTHHSSPGTAVKNALARTRPPSLSHSSSSLFTHPPPSRHRCQDRAQQLALQQQHPAQASSPLPTPKSQRTSS